MSDKTGNFIGLTAQIVSAHVSHNAVAPDQLPELIRNVHASLTRASQGEPEVPPATPAVPIKQSIKPEAVICLECGKGFSMLKRHLGTDHKLSPLEYRAKWRLAADYPLVAPNYANVRSALAKQIGLGTKPRTANPPALRAKQRAIATRKGRAA